MERHHGAHRDRAVSREDHSGNVSRSSAAPVLFADAHGERWSVKERDTRNEPGAKADSCLVFSNENAIRRVWKYPRDWRALGPAELEALGARP